MNNYSPLIIILTGETTHENSRFRSQLLEKTSVLNHALLARLKSQFLPSATATLATFATVENLTKPNIKRELLEKTIVLKSSKVRDLKSGVRFSHLTFASHLLRNDKVQKANNGTITARISVAALLVSLLATCQPSYANNVKVQQRVNEKNTKFSLRLNSKSEESSQLEKINQLSFFDSFNCVAKVAVTGNNLKQELQNLFVTVQHHTIVDVFLCLSFANCLFTGELRLALALVRLWWGGDGNKPFIRRIPSAVVTAVLNLPAALYLGLITQTSLPVRKVL